jgi:hypothetical protein
MKDLPLRPLQEHTDRNFLPPLVPSVDPKGVEAFPMAGQPTDASILSLPRKKALTPLTDDVGTALNSFLTEVSKNKDASGAHSGLDATRVFNLLNDVGED